MAGLKYIVTISEEIGSKLSTEEKEMVEDAVELLLQKDILLTDIKIESV